MIMLKLVWRRNREGHGSGSVRKSLLSRGSAAFPESERPVHGRAPLHAPRLPSRASAAIISPATPRADVWCRRGTVVVPRGVGWRAVEPVPSGACWNRQIFKARFGRHLHHDHCYRAALIHSDDRLVLSVLAKSCHALLSTSRLVPAPFACSTWTF